MLLHISLFVRILLFFSVNARIPYGLIRHTSVQTNTSFIATASSTCLDCLCGCVNNSTGSTCHGINCFPSNRSCQRIEQPWIQQADLLYDSTSDQFLNTIDIKFCSCYSGQNILNLYQNVTPITITYPLPRYLTYNPYDDTLLVLGDYSIGQYYVGNLTRFRSLSTSNTPLAIVVDGLNIYIAMYNLSVNQYDMNLGFIQSIRRPIAGNYASFYGLAKWKNQLFVTDQQLSSIWSINLSTMNMSLYLNMTSYNFAPFSITLFNNHLYISQLSSPLIYIYDLILSSFQQVTFPNFIPLYRSQLDPFCNRIWFGTNQSFYTSVPIFDLGTNTGSLYQGKGILAQSQTFKVEFDSNYSMYTVAKGGNAFYKYQMTTVIC